MKKNLRHMKIHIGPNTSATTTPATNNKCKENYFNFYNQQVPVNSDHIDNFKSMMQWAFQLLI
jgi:hypothetical protein